MSSVIRRLLNQSQIFLPLLLKYIGCVLEETNMSSDATWTFCRLFEIFVFFLEMSPSCGDCPVPNHSQATFMVATVESIPVAPLKEA